MKPGSWKSLTAHAAAVPSAGSTSIFRLWPNQTANRSHPSRCSSAAAISSPGAPPSGTLGVWLVAAGRFRPTTSAVTSARLCGPRRGFRERRTDGCRPGSVRPSPHPRSRDFATSCDTPCPGEGPGTTPLLQASFHEAWPDAGAGATRTSIFRSDDRMACCHRPAAEYRSASSAVKQRPSLSPAEAVFPFGRLHFCCLQRIEAGGSSVD